MGYRIVADENIDGPTRQYLEQLGHDVVWIGAIEALGLSATDEAIMRYAVAKDQLVLTQDTDFFTTLEPGAATGILFQPDQRMASSMVAEIIDVMSRQLPQEDVELEFISPNWL